MAKLDSLSDEIMVMILSYLRSVDVGHAAIVDKTVMSRKRVSYAVKIMLTQVFTSCSVAMLKKNAEISVHSMIPYNALATEVSCILSAINSPQPTNNKGYWISLVWLTNARKYYEYLSTIEMPRIAGNRKSPGKSARRRVSSQRKIDDVQRKSIEISLCINEDITCDHGGLIPSKCSRNKRRMIDHSSWQFLRKLFPYGAEFKCAASGECALCIAKFKEEQDSQTLSDIMDSKLDESSSSFVFNVSPALRSLASRRSGVPYYCVLNTTALEEIDSATMATSNITTYGGDVSTTHCAVISQPYIDTDMLDFMTEEDVSEWIASMELIERQQQYQHEDGGGGGISRQRLVPGMYNLVPRQWLKLWRKSLRMNNDAAVNSTGITVFTSNSISTNNSSPLSMLMSSSSTFIRSSNNNQLPPLDCTNMLCHNHGLLVVPLHVEEYLVGLRKTLLGGLGLYQGEVVEILSQTEWEALTESLHGLSDFSVRFSLDGHNISWNIPICTRCDRINYCISESH